MAHPPDGHDDGKECRHREAEGDEVRERQQKPAHGIADRGFEQKEQLNAFAEHFADHQESDEDRQPCQPRVR